MPRTVRLKWIDVFRPGHARCLYAASGMVKWQDVSDNSGIVAFVNNGVVTTSNGFILWDFDDVQTFPNNGAFNQLDFGYNITAALDGVSPITQVSWASAPGFVIEYRSYDPHDETIEYCKQGMT